MKQLLNELLGKLGQALLGIACLHEMDTFPLEAGNFFATIDPSQEEGRYIVGLTRLKSEDAVDCSKQARWS